MGKKKTLKKYKPRVPVPPPAQPHSDKRKEQEKKACRKKVRPTED
ncbi:MAG: hypothetical protein ACLFUS_16080 [Candidatus Sumerlaeia bacterium]